MKNPINPRGGLPTHDELNKMILGAMQSGGDLYGGLMKLKLPHDDMPLAVKDILDPDTFGAERLFLEYFVNDDMEADFPLVANDFLVHEFANLSKYDDVEYLNHDTGACWPDRMLTRFVLSLMLNAVNGGSEYTKSLFLYLYKTYYKKEYKALKRFSTISSSEVIALAEPDTGAEYLIYGNIARILCISKMFGITINPDCGHIYVALNKMSDSLDAEDRYSFDISDDDLHKNSTKEIEERFDEKKLYSIDWKMSKFLGNVLKWLGYTPDYVDCCDDNEFGLQRRYAITLSILKKTFPKKEFSAEEIALYGTILHTASALTCNTDKLAETIKTLAYGEAGTDYYENFPAMFKAEEVQVASRPAKSPGVIDQTKKLVKEIKKTPDPEKEEALIEEINVLRRKVHKLEADNKGLRSELSEKRRIEEDAKALRERSENANRELVALRDYVYNLTEDDRPDQSISIDAMKKFLSEKRIVIIGGHSNWVSKMKKEFPDWCYVNPEASGSTDVSIVDKADHVYFFTDTISHSKYFQFINVVRERKVDFGYINGVNIEKTVRGIYRELKED
jgi:hypothetical protein